MLHPEQQRLFDLPSFNPSVDSEVRAARSGTFTDNMKLPVHRWFRYSAGFSAQWVENLVRDLKPAVVLDPFAGSGTSLLAAQAAGALAYGYENHPFVARIATAKTHWNQRCDTLADCAKAVLASASRRPAADLAGSPDLMLKCYTPEALIELYAIRDSYLELVDEMQSGVAELIWLAITSILRTCSFVGTAQWQYVLPNKRKSRQVKPSEAFGHKISEILSDIQTMTASGCRSDATVLLHDARNLPPQELWQKVDLVITSPPYPNNYDYADATRLEMTFWGEVRGWGDLQDVVRRYIIRSCSQHAAAERLELPTLLADPLVDPIRRDLSDVCYQLADVRLTKGGKKTYHTMVAAYFGDLARVLKSLRVACAPDGAVCFVIGDSAPYGIYVPAERWLGELAIAAGFKSFSFEKLRDRNIKWKNRKHRVPLHEGRLWIKG